MLRAALLFGEQLRPTPQASTSMTSSRRKKRAPLGGKVLISTSQHECSLAALTRVSAPVLAVLDQLQFRRDPKVMALPEKQRILATANTKVAKSWIAELAVIIC
jgi:hypothetical protein